MAANKVIFGNTTVIDLTNDDVTAADVISGKYFHLPSGVRTVGTAIDYSIDVANYSLLPASGKLNQIALINNTVINDVYLQPSEPVSPSEGDVWIMTGWEGNVYVEISILKVYLTTCRQYISGAWTVIPEWYVYTNAWTRARLYLIQNGQITGAKSFASRKWKWHSGSSTPAGTLTFEQRADHVYLHHKNTSTTSGEMGGTGICTDNFNAGQYSQIYIDVSTASSYQSCERYIVIASYNDSYIALNPFAYKDISTATAEARTQHTVPITHTDDPCCVYYGMNVRNSGNTATAKIYTLYLE